MNTKSMWMVPILLAAATVLGSPPPNDDCEGAILISGEGVFSFDNSAATGPDNDMDCDEVPWSPDARFPNDVWFRWISVCPPDYVTVDTCGQTTLDTKVLVRDGCGVLGYGGDCNDNACGYQSRVITYTSPGYEHWISVSSYPGLGGGVGTFRITCGSPCDPYGRYCPPPSPDSLGCPSPTQPSDALEICNARGHWDAHNSTRLQYIVADEFVPGADGEIRGVCWWGTYLRDGEECARELVDFFEITYYADDCGAPGEIIAGPFSQEDVTMEVIGPLETYESFPNGAFEYQYSAAHDPVQLFAGETYWISITNSYYNNCAWFWGNASETDGHSVQFDDRTDTMELVNADMAFCFRMVESDTPVCYQPLPDNDECVAAQALSIEGEPFTTVGATTDGPVNVPQYGPPHRGCDFPLGDEQVHADVWYDFQAPCSGALRIEACESSFDTKLAVYEGAACPPETPAVACNDDACGDELARQSQMTVNVTGGDSYKLRVGGYNGAWGDGTIRAEYSAYTYAALSDLAVFTRCFTGPCGPCELPQACCSVQDFDADGDVDVEDFSLLHAVLVGP